jgi:hypothetical protein
MRIVISVIIGLTLSAVAYAENDNDKFKGCTNASVKGFYAFYQTGEVVGKGPAADVGTFTSDGKGAFTGGETVHLGSANPVVVDITFDNGTYQVNPDCTGTMQWTAVLSNGTPIGIRTATISIAKNSKEINVLSTVLGSVLVGVAKQ